jgi:hypothetical protein
LKFRVLIDAFGRSGSYGSMIMLKHMAKNLFHVNDATIKWAEQQY